MQRTGIRHSLTAAALAAIGLVACLGAGAARAESVAAPDSAQEIRPLLIGAEAPAVTLRRADGSSFDLKAAIEEKPTILIFYRGGW